MDQLPVVLGASMAYPLAVEGKVSVKLNPVAVPFLFLAMVTTEPDTLPLHDALPTSVFVTETSGQCTATSIGPAESSEVDPAATLVAETETALDSVPQSAAVVVERMCTWKLAEAARVLPPV